MSRQTVRLNGTVKNIVRDKGFGFVRDDTGADWFFHRSAMSERQSFDRLNEGDAVTFEPGNSPKGPRAEDVRTF